MHQIFSIAEVLDAILQDLLKDEPSALSNLAQTCRFLEDPAFDVLWNIQRSLVPLIRVASESIEERVKDGCTLIDSPKHYFERCTNRENSVINLRKPFSLYEKGRISRYASRIQTFRSDIPRFFPYYHDYPQSISDGVLLELFRDHAHAATRFPRLHKVAFPFLGLQTDRYFSLLSFFLNPELQELKITQQLPELMYSALELMPCRGLRKLELPMHMATFSLPRSLGLHSMISQLHNLEELCCDMTLSHWKDLAAALPLLRVVEVSIVDDIQSGTTEHPASDYLVLSDTAPLFASLLTLKVQCSTISSFIALLTSYRLPSVQYVQVLQMGTTQRGDLVMFSALPKVFQTHLSSSLLDIQIEVAVTTTLDRKLLSPFFQFPEIEQFVLNANWEAVDLADRDIEGLATAWPNLRHLNIQSHTDLFQTNTLYVNSVTLKALFFIAHHCPHISFLRGLYLKADEWPDSEDGRPGGGYEAPKFRILTPTLTSTFNIKNVPKIALLLSDIFPNLEEIEIHPWDDPKYWEWRSVTDMAKTISLARRQERNWFRQHH